MEDSSQRWLVVRLTLATLSIPVWLVVRAAMPDDFSLPPNWYFPCVLASFSLLSVMAWSTLQPDSDWSQPNWSANPLDRHRPLEGLHLAGWSFVLGALGLLVASMLRGPADWAWVLPGSIGIGLLIGVRLVAGRNGP